MREQKIKAGQLVKCHLTGENPRLAIVVQGGNTAAQIVWAEADLTTKPQWIAVEWLEVVS